jgi:hypothetical protein
MNPFERHELAALFEDVEPHERWLPEVEQVDWGVLDFFGWLHPAGHLGYVALRLDGEAVGLVLRRALPSGRSRRMHMCAWCHTLHRAGGVAMFSRWVDGSDGRRSIGLNLCSALDCSLRLRNLTGDPRLVMPETIDLQRRIFRLEQSVASYVRRVRPRAGGGMRASR